MKKGVIILAAILCFGIAGVLAYRYFFPAKRATVNPKLEALLVTDKPATKYYEKDKTEFFRITISERFDWVPTGVYVQNRAMVIIAHDPRVGERPVPYEVKVGNRIISARDAKNDFLTLLLFDNTKTKDVPDEAWFNLTTGEQIYLKLPENTDFPYAFLDIHRAWK